MLVLFLSVVPFMVAQSCPDSKHPHAIDLGIGMKFACCNIGAISPEQYGGIIVEAVAQESQIVLLRNNIPGTKTHS